MPNSKGKVTLSPEQVATVERLWGEGENIGVICLEANVSIDVLKYRRLPGEQLAHLPPKGRGTGKKNNRNEYNPSPDRIRQECEKIQAGWSDGERQLRAFGHASNKHVESSVITREERIGRTGLNPIRPGRVL